MPDAVRVAMFCEDEGHEVFGRALVRRLATEVAVGADLDVVTSRGGHGRVIAELKAYQRRLASYAALGSTPHVVVVIVDANCSGWAAMRSECQSVLKPEWLDRAVIACPDPHVERWCMADADAFAHIVGRRPAADPGKCERDLYKKHFRNAVDLAQLPITTGIEELFADIVVAMDWYRAGQRQPSLGAFISDMRSALQRLAGP